MIAADILALDKKYLCHPYSAFYNTAAPWPVAAAHGVRLVLNDGRELIDGMASWWAAIHGYNHPRLNQALIAQSEKMAHVMFGGLTHEPAARLAQQLIKLLPAGLERLFFCDSGSVAVEVAIKAAIQFWQAQGQGQRHRLVALRHAYHGDTFAAMSVCDPVTGMHHLFRPFLPQQFFAAAPACTEHCDEQAVTAMADVLRRHQQQIAAVIVEPIVQGAGGMRVYAADYLRHVCDLCKRYETLLIVDEIATGFGRTGTMFACEQAGISPDILCLGKALGGGYLSLAATAFSQPVMTTIDRSDAGVFMHGPTYMANPLACAVALANLELLASGRWQQQVAHIEQQLHDELSACSHYATVNEVRVKGAIGVIEMKRAVEVPASCRRFVERGVWVRPFANVIYIMPPYIIDSKELSQLTKAMCDVAMTI